MVLVTGRSMNRTLTALVLVAVLAPAAADADPASEPGSDAQAGPTLIATAGNASWSVDDPAQIAAVQGGLASAGTYRGPVDGAWSARLVSALELYQTRKGLPDTGVLDVETAATFGLDNCREAAARFGPPTPGDPRAAVCP